MKTAFAFLLFACLAPAAINYSYDSAGRLIKVDYGNGSVIIYNYDNNGNLTGRSVQTSSGGATPVISGVTTAFAPAAVGIAQNTWIVVKGSNLVPPATPAAGVIWSSAPSFASGQMPTQLGGISVTVNGKPAFIYFFCSAATSPVCTSDQINALTPLDSTLGSVSAVVNNNGISSAPITVNMNPIAPSFLLFDSAGHIVATHLSGSLLGPANLYPGASTPAKPGEVIVAYAVGFGLPTAAIVNGSASQSGTLGSVPVCQIGGTAAPVAASLISPGLYQLNLTIPSGAASGDNPISCVYGGSTTPSGDLITVQQ